MIKKKQIIGEPITINGRLLSLSKAVKAGDYIFLTGQVPMKNGEIMTCGTIEEQTVAVLTEIKKTLSLAKCSLKDVVKSMIWLSKKDDFPGFNKIYGSFFPKDPPARSAIVNQLLVDVKVEIEVIAYKQENS